MPAYIVNVLFCENARVVTGSGGNSEKDKLRQHADEFLRKCRKDIRGKVPDREARRNIRNFLENLPDPGKTNTGADRDDDASR